MSVFLFLNVKAKKDDRSANPAPASGIIAFYEHFNPPCISFLEMDIDFSAERESERVVKRHRK